MCRRISTTLYHGTVSEIQQVDVKLGKGRKDFGKGFYMAESKKQAIGMMHKKYREAVRRSRGKQEAAYKQLLTSELYKLLQDSETRLFLERNEYLCEAWETEITQGERGLYKYINRDIF